MATPTSEPNPQGEAAQQPAQQAAGAEVVPAGCQRADSAARFKEYRGPIVSIDSGWAVQETRLGLVAHKLDEFTPKAQAQISQAFEQDGRANLRYENGKAKCWSVDLDYGLDNGRC